MLNVSLPTTIHDVPSADTEALMVWPARANFTHRGAMPASLVLVLTLPVVVRRWNATPLPADTSMNACADEAPSVSRIMTPALVHAATSSTDATRATTAASPLNVVYAY